MHPAHAENKDQCHGCTWRGERTAGGEGGCMWRGERAGGRGACLWGWSGKPAVASLLGRRSSSSIR